MATRRATRVDNIDGDDDNDVVAADDDDSAFCSLSRVMSESRDTDSFPHPRTTPLCFMSVYTCHVRFTRPAA